MSIDPDAQQALIQRYSTINDKTVGAWLFTLAMPKGNCLVILARDGEREFGFMMRFSYDNHTHKTYKVYQVTDASENDVIEFVQGTVNAACALDGDTDEYFEVLRRECESYLEFVRILHTHPLISSRLATTAEIEQWQKKYGKRKAH